MMFCLAASPAAVSGAWAAASCACTAVACASGAPPLLGKGLALPGVSLAKVTIAFVPGAAAFAFGGTGPRSAGAGGALGVVIGAVTAVALFTPGGTAVVRLRSEALQAVSASATPPSTSAVEDFMQNSSGLARCDRVASPKCPPIACRAIRAPIYATVARRADAGEWTRTDWRVGVPRRPGSNCRRATQEWTGGRCSRIRKGLVQRRIAFVTAWHEWCDRPKAMGNGERGAIPSKTVHGERKCFTTPSFFLSLR